MIPVGGSSALGTWGYLEAAKEMDGQLREAGITDVALVRCLSSVTVLARVIVQSALGMQSWTGADPPSDGGRCASSCSCVAHSPIYRILRCSGRGVCYAFAQRGT